MLVDTDQIVWPDNGLGIADNRVMNAGFWTLSFPIDLLQM